MAKLGVRTSTCMVFPGTQSGPKLTEHRLMKFIKKKPQTYGGSERQEHKRVSYLGKQAAECHCFPGMFPCSDSSLHLSSAYSPECQLRPGAEGFRHTHPALSAGELQDVLMLSSQAHLWPESNCPVPLPSSSEPLSPTLPPPHTSPPTLTGSPDCRLKMVTTG